MINCIICIKVCPFFLWVRSLPPPQPYNGSNPSCHVDFILILICYLNWMKNIPNSVEIPPHEGGEKDIFFSISGGSNKSRIRRGKPLSCLQTETTQPITTQPITTQPITTQPITTQPITTQPITTQPITIQKISLFVSHRFFLNILLGFYYIFSTITVWLCWIYLAGARTPASFETACRLASSRHRSFTSLFDLSFLRLMIVCTATEILPPGVVSALPSQAIPQF